MCIAKVKSCPYDDDDDDDDGGGGGGGNNTWTVTEVDQRVFVTERYKCNIC
jgi:hypothetical protein